MMGSLYSQNFKANLLKCQDERLACDGGVKLARLDGHSLNTNEVKLFRHSVLNL